MTEAYQRPAFSLDKQFIHLAGLGMEMPSLSEFKSVIANIGYYRFKAYMLPFRNQDRTFVANASFHDVVAVYSFDQKLRALVFHRIQELEVSLRVQFNEHMVAELDCPFWYIREEIVSFASDDFRATLKKVSSHFHMSNEEFAKYYREKFHNEVSEQYQGMPPTWMAIELMTFGNLVTFMNGLSDQTIQDYRLDRFAKKHFGVAKFKTLTNWLLCVRDVRNHTAHHSRLFNRNLRALNGILNFLTEKVPEVESNGKKSQVLNRPYTALAGLQVLSAKQNMLKMGPELKSLFDLYPVTARFFTSMGFPENWQNEGCFF
ncbi:MAG: Abi family protein [Alphaproteobacteria bacterium]|nr:Abi family protein [Alphaproteobacteria bacterium]MBU1278136.1 Abi family protein [Alphaproteobacteria bacterium]MBU1573995.1 Abi family protein [Alphaproteobacteria bacterium]MBU1826972.1 Abi family protein [Alphaproteobacteria bacterium]MBU2077219.1 Abi family protein [Alphaproteobacteria bacterium]